MATDNRFEHFIENDEEWFTGIELKVADLEQELCEWRESRTRDLAEPAQADDRALPRPGTSGPSPGTSRWPPGTGPRCSSTGGGARPGRALVRGAPGGTGRPGRARPAGPARAAAARSRVWSAAGLAALVIGAMIVLRQGPSWPPSVATVQREITTACQNPNTGSEPGQVNFACGQDTSQILWVFSLMTSGNDPGYADPRTGRTGLEPIAPAQGGQIAWSLNLHHPYNPLNPVDSLAVAARAINNIIGGATLTAASGRPAVQPGLESRPENCARYTGSSALVSRAGFPSLCASPVTSQAGRAALAADVYQRWMPGASALAAQNVSVLFQNAGNPGDPQVQAILRALPHPGR